MVWSYGDNLGYGISLCCGVSPRYCVSLGYDVSLCYGISPRNEVSPCNDVSFGIPVSHSLSAYHS